MNPLLPLPTRLFVFYRWIVKLSRQQGFAWMRTAELARRQTSRHADKEHVNPATVWRWIKQLEASGYLRIEYVPGSHERRLHPLVSAPSRRPKCNQNASQNASKSCPPLLSELGYVATTTAPTPMPVPTKPPPPATGVVAELMQVGIARHVAERLYAQQGEAACRRQLDALPRRKSANPPAVLVASILGGWDVPKPVAAQAAKPAGGSSQPYATLLVPSPAQWALLQRGDTPQQQQGARP